MGKSPGKWIKTLLFGKKSSKSNFSKKTVTEKAFVADPSSDLAANFPPPSVSVPAVCPVDRSRENLGLAKGTTANLPHDEVVLLSENQDEDIKETTGLGSPDNTKITQQVQAVTKVQAAFRGYLACRAFRALKGIIRLQAVVRAHLVRRQAIATLYCMQGIVKLQALVRGRRIRLSDVGLEVQKKCGLGKSLNAKRVDSVGVIVSPGLEKLSTNVFVVKLLASLPSFIPLHLQYEPTEPNSIGSWLERWSSTRFWEPLVQPKKASEKSQRRSSGSRNVEMEQGRPKRSVRRASTLNADNNSLLPTSEHERPKHSLKKTLSHPTESAQENPPIESVQENPPNELERVKRNLRKVSLSSAEAQDRSETVLEKPRQILRKLSSPQTPDIQELATAKISEKANDPTISVSKEPETDVPSKPLAIDEPIIVPHDDHPAVEVCPSDNIGIDENVSLVNEELCSKEDQTNKEPQRTRRRRSLSAKQEYPENCLQNSPSLPSYMAATESAKAKVRSQGSPRFGQDGAENGFVRRHSLPSYSNGKLSSPSPRMQRLVQASGKGVSKSDRSLSSSRDGHERLIQAEWRR